MGKKEKKQESKTTYVKITFGFGKNKFDYPKVYRKGSGESLHDALVHLFRQRGNNFLPEPQRLEIINQLSRAFETITNENYVHVDQRRDSKKNSKKSEE